MQPHVRTQRQSAGWAAIAHPAVRASHSTTGAKSSPAIFVASLADYNNGVLHGKWIDAAREPWEIQADINDILDSSRQPDAEEWAIHDYEQFGSWKVDE